MCFECVVRPHEWIIQKQQYKVPAFSLCIYSRECESRSQFFSSSPFSEEPVSSSCDMHPGCEEQGAGGKSQEAIRGIRNI